MTGALPRPTEAWVAARRAGAVRALRAAVSATELVRRRDGFGSVVRPAPGSILASPRMAAWDPEPDYFHHWVRDAAVAVRVLPEILGAVDEDDRSWWRRAFADHVAFSLGIGDPARQAPAGNPLEATARPGHRRFLRPDHELAALTGAAWLGEPRFAADGGTDLERWSRPQDDGPALRAAATMHVTARAPELATPDTARLIARDLAYLVGIAGRPCIGPWEEEPARRTTFTLIATWDALDRGARWHAAHGRDRDAGDAAAAAHRVERLTLAALDPEGPVWRESIEAPAGHADSATLLAILHADRTGGPFALDAPATRGTLAALEATFRALYPINRDRSVPAMGRWATDVFFDGNPWVPITLGCAEIGYRVAARTGDADAFARAEAWMALIEEVAPPGDALPEQFDRTTGAPVSCLGLTWSAAAFVGAAAARDAAVQTSASR